MRSVGPVSGLLLEAYDMREGFSRHEGNPVDVPLTKLARLSGDELGSD